MFVAAILIGVYSYLIFTLGLLHQLYLYNIVYSTAVYVFLCLLWFRKSLKNFFLSFLSIRWNLNEGSTLTYVLIALIALQAIVNLLGALGPELAFDALWYHLTLPKLYLENHSIFYIPGGLLYYSAMPKLTEMLYVSALSFDSEVLAKLIHFSFGMLTLVALYKLSRRFFSTKYSLLVLVVFYANLVVAWQSITAYVDLSRTFFELLSLWAFVLFMDKRKKKWIVLCAIMLGLAVPVKLLAIGSLLIITILTIASLVRSKKPIKEICMSTISLVGTSLIIPLPWFIFSFFNTGNPVYPFFTKTYEVQFDMNLLNPIRFLKDAGELFLYSTDPLNPMYLISLPLLLMRFKKFGIQLKYIGLYSFLALIIWYITPRTGGGRFIMPYVPAFSVLTVATIKHISSDWLKKFLIIVVIFISVVSIGYRSLANVKYIPVILSIQSKEEFLSKNLNFSFGDFYDIDGYFKRNIKKNDRILVYGIHNLYYVNFPFMHESYVKKGDSFNYILVQYGKLPDRFRHWELLYANDTTFVKLYTLGGKMWTY